MKPIQLEDVEKLLDLMDEASMKSDYQFSVEMGFSWHQRKEKILLDVYVMEEEPEERNKFKVLFSRFIRIGETIFPADERKSYDECIDCLRGLINGEIPWLS